MIYKERIEPFPHTITLAPGITAMNNQVRQKLREMIDHHGRSVCEDPQRCEGLLREVCAEDRLEVNVLMAALREGACEALLRTSEPVPTPVLGQLAERLRTNAGLTEEIARWAVHSWALALGALSPEECYRLEQGTSAIGAPPVGEPPTAGGEARGTLAPAVETLVVDQGGLGDYRAIKDATMKAQPGTRILVRPGAYRESVTLNKELEIVGDGPRESIIIEPSEESCIRMRTQRALVHGLTLRGVTGYAVDVTRGSLVVEDCDITCRTHAAVAIHGSSADPVIRNCTVHGAGDAGVFVFDGGKGTVEGCDIFGNANSGIHSQQRGNPVVRRCRIHRGKSDGVSAVQNGKARVEECEIFDNAGVGVSAAQGGELLVQKCTIHAQNVSATETRLVLVSIKARATVEDCDISRCPGYGVDVNTRGELVMRRCRIHHCSEAGCLVDRSRATLEQCDISENGATGVHLQQRSNALLRECRIHGSYTQGIYVIRRSSATVEESTVFGNGDEGILVERGSHVTIRGGDIQDPVVNQGGSRWLPW